LIPLTACWSALPNPAITSSGFEQLDLSLSTEEGVLFARTFTSVSDAQAFFTNNVIDLGPIGSNHNVTDTNGISSPVLTTHDASAGFNASFALGIASNRWTSNSSGDWDSPANWSHDAVPNNTYRSRVDFLNNNASAPLTSGSMATAALAARANRLQCDPAAGIPESMM